MSLGESDPSGPRKPKGIPWVGDFAFSARSSLASFLSLAPAGLLAGALALALQGHGSGWIWDPLPALGLAWMWMLGPASAPLAALLVFASGRFIHGDSLSWAGAAAGALSGTLALTLAAVWLRRRPAGGALAAGLPAFLAAAAAASLWTAASWRIASGPGIQPAAGAFLSAWLRDALGMLAWTPFLVTMVLPRMRFPAQTRRDRNAAPAEGGAKRLAPLLLGLSALAALVFFLAGKGFPELVPLLFMGLLALAHAGSMEGATLGMLAILLCASPAIWPGLAGGREMLGLQTQLATLALGGLALGSLFIRRRPALAAAAPPAPEPSGAGGAMAGAEPEFSDLFGASTDGLCLVDGDVVKAANPSLETLFGYPAGALEGRALSVLLGEAAEGVLRDQVLFPFETLGYVRDGAPVKVEVSGHPFPWRNRRLRLLTLRDITERKSGEDALRRSEQALRKSEGAMRAILAHSPLVLIALDKDGVFTVAEGRALEAAGMKRGELTGQSVFAKPSRLRAMQGAVRRALEGGEVDDTLEMSGHVFEIHLRPLPGPNGTADGVMGLAVDVTERNRAEEELRRSKEHLRTVISSSPMVLFAMDNKGTFTLSEGKGLEALGLNPGEVIGKSVFEIYRDVPQIRVNVRRALSGEQFTSTVELGGLWFETYFSPVFKGYDEVSGVIGVAINVTDRKRAEDALRRSEEQLRHSHKMEAIGRVAGGVAHDFNNLLTAITGYAELLLTAKGGEGAEPQRRNLEEIRRAADRATVLTRQLLAFSRRQVLNPTMVNLNQMVGEMDKMLRRLIREDVDIVTVLDPQLGEVWADPGQMEQVILNLALNARDAMPEGGLLTLESANVDLESPYARGELFLVPGPYVMLSISDTGLGMDEEVKAHLFEPFFTTKEDSESLGLGLSTVYGIVKQSGGTISAESERSRGTTFKVFLPRVDKAVPQRLGGNGDDLKGVETILLVEDEEAVRTLVREILRMHGYRVLEARSGGEAILISQRHEGSLHMLLTDVVMANMSGRELAEHLRPLRPEMRVLYISGYSEDSLLRSGHNGIDASFLAKPFTPKTLAQKVREVLDGKGVEPAGMLKKA